MKATKKYHFWVDVNIMHEEAYKLNSQCHLKKLFIFKSFTSLHKYLNNVWIYLQQYT